MIIQRAKLHFMHSIEDNNVPSSFELTWTKNNATQQNHNLRNMDKYVLPHPRIEFFKKIPLYSLPKEWNNIGDLTLNQLGSEMSVTYWGPFGFDLAFTRCKLTFPGI
jgi:hypothetical protein